MVQRSKEIPYFVTNFCLQLSDEMVSTFVKNERIQQTNWQCTSMDREIILKNVFNLKLKIPRFKHF